MADSKRKVPENTEGDYFVDLSCENFGICKELAPQLFTRLEDYHYLSKQPESGAERRLAMQAVLCCPKGAIGAEDRALMKAVFDDFPMLIEDEVYYCGFNTIKSAGANSYFIRHDDGNWLISTPKFLSHLIDRFASMGGVKYIFLTHRDDLGETAKYAGRFQSKVILHRMEQDSYPAAEIVIDSTEAIPFARDFLIIKNPGHTEGHCMLLYKEKFLFSGDSLRYNFESRKLELWDPYWTWYSYKEQARSTAQLLNHQFSWVLCSHGGRAKLDRTQIHANLKESIESALACKDEEPADKKRKANLMYYAGELRKLGQTSYAEKIEKKLQELEQATDSKTNE